jgi:hypothetical protein
LSPTRLSCAMSWLHRLIVVLVVSALLVGSASMVYAGQLRIGVVAVYVSCIWICVHVCLFLACCFEVVD